MDISNFNSEEYQIMTSNNFNNKLDCYNHYLKFNEGKFSHIEKLRIFSKNVSEFLIKVTDEKKYSNEDIYKNLENCLYNRKACVFSLGYNINEHKDKFHEFKKYQEFTICCWKSSVNFFDNISDVDIIGIGNYINNQTKYVQKIQDNFKVLFNNYKKGYNHYNQVFKNFLQIYEKGFSKSEFINKNDKLQPPDEDDKILINNCDVFIFKFIIFLFFLGIKEFYLFGFFIDTKWLDIRNYNYYDDIISDAFHYYNTEDKSEYKKVSNVFELAKFRVKEPGIMSEQINSYYLKDWIDFNNVTLYNVSKKGCYSNRIPRINFDSIFKSKKDIISSEYKYEDFVTQYDKYVDKDYLLKKFGYNNIWSYASNIYNIPALNKDDDRNYVPNNMILQIQTLIPYLFKYPGFKDKKNYEYNPVFFCHYLLSFNKAFNLCYYHDFRKISKEEFWDNLLLENEIEIKFKLQGINYNEEYKNTFLNNNKYFKLFLYMVFFKDLPNDFSFEGYKKHNYDLANMNFRELIMHYILNGKEEKRRYN